MSRTRKARRVAPRKGFGRSNSIGIAIAVFLICLGVGVGLGARRAEGEEPTASMPALEASADQTKDALEAAGIKPSPEAPEIKPIEAEPAETDPAVAEELPHRDLDREGALELAEGVFGVQLEEPAGIYGDLEVTKFLSNDVAVVSSSSLPGATDGEEDSAEAALPPEGSVLVESALPLRVENEEGEEEQVDLQLQEAEGSGGMLEPTNPLVGVEVPAHLGEGITLPESELAIAVEGAPAEQTPSNVEGQYAFYPNVAQDTDLAVAPTATGVDLMTAIRSADAPTSTTYQLSLPAGAEVKTGVKGTVEVVEDGKTTTLIVPPSATDAAGASVPATQRVEGDKLIVKVTPESSTQFPILVDPEIINDGWNWTYWHQSQKAWTPSSTATGLGFFPYAFWETQSSPPNPNPAPGLDLTSAGWGNAHTGTQSQWVYTVPRYNEDYAHGYGPPSTWIYQLWTENDWFLTHGNTGYYPAEVLGLADPAEHADQRAAALPPPVSLVAIAHHPSLREKSMLGCPGPG
jgi:hypothetical protein